MCARSAQPSEAFDRDKPASFIGLFAENMLYCMSKGNDVDKVVKRLDRFLKRRDKAARESSAERAAEPPRGKQPRAGKSTPPPPTGKSPSPPLPSCTCIAAAGASATAAVATGADTTLKGAHKKGKADKEAPQEPARMGATVVGGSRSNTDCRLKAFHEVNAGRMPEPGGKRQQAGGKKQWNAWQADEVERLREGVSKFGRDWVSVATHVRTRTKTVCFHKVQLEAAAGRMEDPAGKRQLTTRTAWQADEVERLREGVSKFGRDWFSVAMHVRTRTKSNCFNKVQFEIAGGRMEDPAGKRQQKQTTAWTKQEVARLMAAVQKNGRDWLLVAADVGTRSNNECSAKVIVEVAAGRMQEVPGKRTYVRKQRQPVHAPAPAPAADPKSSTSKDNADDKDNEDRSNEMLPEGAATPASSSLSGSSAGSASGSSAG